MQRTSWDEYFISIAQLVATRSTCLRRQVGCVLVRDRRILATGYNGVPSGHPHCLDIGCLRAQQSIPSGERLDICRAIHAEQNAILQAATFGIAIQGATLYCTTYPCHQCRKLLINAGIRRVCYAEYYPHADEEQMGDLRASGIEVCRVSMG